MPEHPVNGLRLLVPGLLDPVGGADPAGLPLPEMPGLSRWLKGARVASGPAGNGITAVAELFGCATDQLPAGALSYLGATGRRPDGAVLRADPVFFRVETDHLLLFDASTLGLSAAEADALVTRFNKFYEAEGWRLEAPGADQWFLCGFDGPVHTTPLDQVQARNVGPFMPEGEAGAALRALMNEVQMLFFEHPVNAEREQRGQPVVSGIWPWGEGGTLPEQLPAVWDGVWADDALIRGAASLSQTPLSPPPASWREGIETWKRPGRYLVVIETAAAPARQGDVGGWMTALEALECNWFAPMARERGLNVTLLTGDGRALVSGRRWPWRRGLSLSALLSGGGL